MRAKLLYAALAASFLAACGDRRGPTEVFVLNININGSIASDTAVNNGCTSVAWITGATLSSNGRLIIPMGSTVRLTANETSVPAGCRPSQGFTWSGQPTSVVNVVTVNPNTGDVTGVGPGDGEVCAQSIGDSSLRPCVPVTVTGGTGTLQINPIGTVSTGNGCARTFQGVLNQSGVAGTWSVSGISGATVNGSTGAGTLPQGSSGTVTLTFTPQSGAPVSITFQVVSTDCTAQQCQITGFNPTVSSTSMRVGETRQIVHGVTTNMPNCATITYSENTPVLSVSSTGLVQGDAVGNGDVLITATPQNGTAQTVTMTFNVTAAPAGSITWNPATICFSTLAGSQTVQNIAVNITNVPSGTPVTFTSANTGLITVSPTTVNAPNGTITLTRPAGSATGTVRISGSGTNVSGFVDVVVQSTACPGTGNFIDYTPPGGTGTVGSSNPNLTSTCTLASGATCNQQWWYTNRPDVFSIQATDGTITINGTQWPVGPHARVNFIAPGNGLNCVQASITNKDLFRCYAWVSQ